jgi:hypothetical protein
LFKVSVDRVAAPFFKTTVPVGGVPANCGVTVTVNVTGCPGAEGFADETTVELVAALFTICVSTLEELPVTLPSPLYVTVIECVPTANALSINVATLPLTPAVPMGVPPSFNVTVPVAVPPYSGMIVAVKVTDWLSVEGFALDETATALAA